MKRSLSGIDEPMKHRPKFPSFTEGMAPARVLEQVPGPFAAAAYQPQAMQALMDHVAECQRYYQLMMSISGPVMISPQLEAMAEWGRALARWATATGLMSLVNKNTSILKNYVQQRVNVDRRVVRTSAEVVPPPPMFTEEERNRAAATPDPARWGART